MKKINRKRLNNKGFTLVELLAVVIILAVVMGIAMNSVLSTMNKSRLGSLYDSSLVVVDGFNKQYVASLLDGTRNKLYGIDDYNFTANSSFYLVDDLADEFNLSASNYALNSSAPMTKNISGEYADVKFSFVNFNAATEKFVVCLVAAEGGNYSVASVEAKDVNIDGIVYKFPEKVAFACSNGKNSDNA